LLTIVHFSDPFVNYENKAGCHQNIASAEPVNGGALTFDM